MKDPYSVLGVSPSASDDEVKKAYRDLARKYHPDNYHDNPLADLAQEKMKEVNEAYDQITKSRAQGGSGGYGGSYSTSGGYGDSRSSTTGGNNAIRTAINSGNIGYAEQLLNRPGMPHDAEWHFLMGSVCYRKGWLDEARKYYQTAVSMEPNNAEYANALRIMSMGGNFYRPAAYNRGGMDNCDCCTTLCAADCCCECLGGDLIGCC
jgi:curved DNA-binding protein CbpA